MKLAIPAGPIGLAIHGAPSDIDSRHLVAVLDAAARMANRNSIVFALMVYDLPTVNANLRGLGSENAPSERNAGQLALIPEKCVDLGPRGRDVLGPDSNIQVLHDDLGLVHPGCLYNVIDKLVQDSVALPTIVIFDRRLAALALLFGQPAARFNLEAPKAIVLVIHLQDATI